MEETNRPNETKPALPREWEMIVTAFMPNLKLIENRFDRIDIEIRDLHVGQKDISSRMNLLEKRMDLFETQVDKRFEQVDKRFEQVDKRFEGIDHRLEQIVVSIDRLGDKIDARDARQRSFTLRMFGIAITTPFWGYWACWSKPSACISPGFSGMYDRKISRQWAVGSVQ
jgi:chaperonin cofactor prefoldin